MFWTCSQSACCIDRRQCSEPVVSQHVVLMAGSVTDLWSVGMLYRSQAVFRTCSQSECSVDRQVTDPLLSALLWLSTLLSTLLWLSTWWWWWCRPHPVREHAQDLRPPLGARPASPPTRQAAQPPPRGSSTNPRPLA